MNIDSNSSLLLINPWVYDFAAYDYFARPLGLLYLAGRLRAWGYKVHLVDCLDVSHVRSGPFGTGRYPKEVLPNPPVLHDIPRHFGRYGISEADFHSRLAASPPPKAILVTSLMTYWYPGVTAAIRLARERFPGVPVILGGVYATLCSQHARRHSEADLVLPGPRKEEILSTLEELTNLPNRRSPFPIPLRVEPPGERSPGSDYPALDLLSHLHYIPILTSRGCPFDCAYCASKILAPRWRPRPPLQVVEELIYWQDRLKLSDAAFYDDALLVQAETHLLVILEELARRGRTFTFHTPNGLHASLITPETARWLKRANFATLRLGVETTGLGEARLDRKLEEGDLESAIDNLQAAGFSRKQMEVYLLMGLPGQPDEEVAASIRRVKELGATPVLAQYSPLPGTALWKRAVSYSRYDLESDPLFHNNSIFPCWPDFSWTRFAKLKRLVEE